MSMSHEVIADDDEVDQAQDGRQLAEGGLGIDGADASDHDHAVRVPLDVTPDAVTNASQAGTRDADVLLRDGRKGSAEESGGADMAGVGRRAEEQECCPGTEVGAVRGRRIDVHAVEDAPEPRAPELTVGQARGDRL
jgi:hypothetical protein